MLTCNLYNNTANWYQLIRKLVEFIQRNKKISFRCYLFNAKKKKKRILQKIRKCESVKRCTRLPQRVHKRDDEAKTNDEKLMHLECRQPRQNTHIRTRKIAPIVSIILLSTKIIFSFEQYYHKNIEFLYTVTISLTYCNFDDRIFK